jgi:hypothetical protein
VVELGAALAASRATLSQVDIHGSDRLKLVNQLFASDPFAAAAPPVALVAPPAELLRSVCLYAAPDLLQRDSAAAAA